MSDYSDARSVEQNMEVRVALIERESTEIRTEVAGIREQNKTHYTELRDSITKSQTESREAITNLTNQVTRLVDSLEREGVYGVSLEELEQKAKDRQFVRDMRGMMGEMAKRTRNTLLTLIILGGLAIAAWFVGVKHPEIFR